MKIDELSDKKGAGGWIGGTSFDAVSGNATTVTKICLKVLGAERFEIATC
jgi:hypothetical protein